MGSTTFRWVPRLPDAFLPLLLGTCEFMMARSVVARSSDWCFAWPHCSASRWWRSRTSTGARGGTRERDVLAALGPWTVVTEALAIAGALVIALAGWLDMRVEGSMTGAPGPTLLASASPFLYALRTALYWRRICPLSRALQLRRACACREVGPAGTHRATGRSASSRRYTALPCRPKASGFRGTGHFAARTEKPRVTIAWLGDAQKLGEAVTPSMHPRSL
jgi:hypothetical protein